MREHIVARVGELPPGGRKIVTVGSISIGVFRIHDDYFALPNVCPHQYGPICEGKIGPAIVANADTDWHPALAHDGEVLACPWHGLEFHVKTGRCLAYPRLRLRQYPLHIDGDDIKIVL